MYDVNQKVDAGWTATDGTNDIKVNPKDGTTTLKFAGDNNIAVTADTTNKAIQVALNDKVYLGGDHTEDSRNIVLDGERGVIGLGSTIALDGRDGTAVIGGVNITTTAEEGTGKPVSTINGLSNTTWEGTTETPDRAATEGQLQSVATEAAKHTTVSGDENITVKHEEGSQDYQVTLNPDVTLKGDNSSIELTGTKGTIQVNQETAEGTDFTNINGNVVSVGYTNSEGTKNAIVIDGGEGTITGLSNTTWDDELAKQVANSEELQGTAATQGQLNDLYNAVVSYDIGSNYGTVTLKGADYDSDTHKGGTVITNVAYSSGNGSDAVNVDYLNDAIKDAVKDGPIASNEKHLDTSTSYTPNEKGEIAIDELDGIGNKTGNQLIINNVASKDDIKDLNDKVGNVDFSGTTHIDKDTNNLTDAIKDLDGAISNMQDEVLDQVENSTITGGHVTEDGKVVLEKGEDNNKSNVETDIQLTDSGVVQEGTSFDKETGTITITSQDKYSGETSSVKVEGIASTEVVGATNKEDLATAYKDADKDGNATTEYITDSESMVEADVALDHAIQDVANTSYANDMVLSNRIDSVEKRLGNVEERIDKVGAMAAAIANLRTMGFDPEAPTEIAIGVGQYKSETGIAIGVFHYPNQDFMLSASLSSSGDELMGGIGATWKLGRKSAAERAKDEEARHLEQAEEMKKLAQQEKVKAQAQRHAKLLAERQQTSQKNA